MVNSVTKPSLGAYDTVEELPCGSVIQHGPNNDRIYLMRPADVCPPSLPEKLIEMAQKHGYTKIFAKVPARKAETFLLSGFYTEAVIPGFYNGQDAGVFLAFCLDSDRKLEREARAGYVQNTEIALEKRDNAKFRSLEEGFSIRPCVKSDIAQMAQIYKEVFPSYPFPIDEPAYLEETMNDNVSFFCVEKEHEGLVALSSIEADECSQNAEMTDFATLPQWRGASLGTHLLMRMEEALKERGIVTSYTIARAASVGMNITFSRLGYLFGGRLKNNTHISGTIESMNVWYKRME